MANPQLAEARRHQATLKEIFVRHVGEAADYRALRRVLALCQAAAEMVDDVYCRDKLRLVGEYAAEMFAHSEHAKWGRDSVSGMEFLRQQVLNALELYLSRLYSLDVIQRARAASKASALQR